MIKILLCDPPLKIGKKGTPVGVEVGQAKNIIDAHLYQSHPSFQGEKELAYYCTDRKRMVRRYGVSDWGKIERYTCVGCGEGKP